MTGVPPDARHEDVRLLMGAYVLGGLDSTDRSALQAHLARCAPCREELSRLVPVPGLLRRVPAGEPAADAPAAAPLEPLLDRVRGERARARQRMRALVLGVAAATVAAAAAGTALVLGGGDGFGPAAQPTTAQPTTAQPTTAQPTTAQPTGAPTPSAPATPGPTTGQPAAPAPPDETQPLRPGPGVATAGRADLTGKPWGTAITATVADLTGDGPYALVVLGAGSRTEQAATWSATPAGTATVAGATSLPPEQIVDVQVLDVDGRVLASTAG